MFLILCQGLSPLSSFGSRKSGGGSGRRRASPTSGASDRVTGSSTSRGRTKVSKVFNEQVNG